MAGRILVLPPGVIPGEPPDRMIEDLLAISEIPREQMEAVGAVLESESGFPNRDRLSEIVRQIVEDERRTSAVVAALHSVPFEGAEQIIQSVREWREADDKNAERFPEESLSAAEENLQRLGRDFPAVQRCRKARRLESILGNGVSSLELICDLRPVFNPQRDTVEGLIPLTTMKIVYEGQDEEVRVLEVRLSQDMLSELLEKAHKAQQKLEILSQSVPKWTPDGLVDLG